MKGRCLSFTEREEIALGRAAGESLRSIAGRLGRSPSTICRERARNRDPIRGYRATTAHALAYDRASRPKAAKLHSNVALRGRVEQDLEKKYSPEQIGSRLRADFSDNSYRRRTPRMTLDPSVCGHEGTALLRWAHSRREVMGGPDQELRRQAAK